ncbi:MAG: serine/threonine-protein kinase, partial [Nannocystaceae bacterium]
MRTGVRIGEWELVRQLNSGGMGQVWQARKVFATGDFRVAAIKLLLPAKVLDQRSRDALHAEARIQMRLQHDNIPKVLDVGVHEGLPYLAMDYIAGRDLSQLLARLRDRGTLLDPKIAAHVARCVAYALHYAHNFEVDGVRQAVIHRDVASKNIMVSGRGGVFVLDFGVAESKGHETSHNWVKGTLLYMAPEHIQGFPSPASDVFGLGTILWEMLEGRVFRAEVAGPELRAKVNEGWVPALTRPGIPDELRFLVEGMLRKDPRDRLTTDEV